MSNLSTSNTSCQESPEGTTEEAMRFFVSACMAIIIAVSIIGNSMVCVAFKVNPHLRTVSNYFILSLAVSDLITTIFVMPFDVELILHRSWRHGEALCQFYTTVYLVSAPASTLNLLAVSIDRFRLIRDPFRYKRTTTPLRALIVIAGIWLYSTLMAFLPLMGWRASSDESSTRSTATNWTNGTSEMATDETSSNQTPNNCTVTCLFQIPFNYSIMMSVLNFVIPPLIMTVIYFKIYQIARSHIRRIHRLESITGAASAGMVNAPDSRRSSRAAACSPLELLETNCNGKQTYLTVPHANHRVAHAGQENGHANENIAHERKGSVHERRNSAHERRDSTHERRDSTHERRNSAHERRHSAHERRTSAHKDTDVGHGKLEVTRRNNLEKRKSRTYSITGNSLLRKNVKAAKSLAIIVGTFFLCWYPYTVMSMAINACFSSSKSCSEPALYVEHLLLSLGFLNSMLNPFLYALHNKEFKRTYKRILRCN